MEDLEILQPFGPSILKVTIPDEMIKQMNQSTIPWTIFIDIVATLSSCARSLIWAF